DAGAAAGGAGCLPHADRRRAADGAGTGAGGVVGEASGGGGGGGARSGGAVRGAGAVADGGLVHEPVPGATGAGGGVGAGWLAEIGQGAAARDTGEGPRLRHPPLPARRLPAAVATPGGGQLQLHGPAR